jgi:hypothetical protein
MLFNLYYPDLNVSATTGIIISSIMLFKCNVVGLSKLCRRCVVHIYKRSRYTAHFLIFLYLVHWGGFNVEQISRYKLWKPSLEKRFNFFVVVKIESMVFWVVAPWSAVVGYQHFGGPCYLHVPPKCWYLTTALHSATTQKTSLTLEKLTSSKNM